MNLLQVKEYIDNFLKEHPKNASEAELRIYSVDKDIWVPVICITNIVTPTCPQYATPLYLHTEEVDIIIKAKNKYEDDFEVYGEDC